ncbi:TIR domain-containing protein [Pigmentiphaga sp.]|uniref:TIR domain-containing protein n=1 Tax=Pigmentiphaga sp. TaxID=1977564 RepID=UPI0025CC0BA5|nr:TIR domain-containing protein [Pigmentiphaga sp.]
MIVAKRVFFSFHYKDVVDFRANVVRKHWVLKGDREEAGYFDASIWEEAEKKNEIGLKRLINGALENTSTTCVLVGSSTYARPWVRYEIIKSVCRGNRVFAVHINQIKGKDTLTKPNGPNPFDYLALKYSADGTKVEVFEAENGKWISFAKLPSYTLQSTAPESKWGRLFKLSSLGRKIYCWSVDKGYDNFVDWVG